MNRLGHFLSNLIIKRYLKATEYLYHQLAWAYDSVAWGVSFGYWHRWQLDALKYLKAGSILEIGFGTGSLLIDMITRGYDVVGLECSSEMQRVTHRKLKRKGIHAKCIKGDAQALPFLDSCYSNIISTFPTTYIFSKATLKEIQRVMVNDGRLIVTGMSVSFKRGFKRWLTRFFLEDPNQILIKRLAEKAEELGFQSTVKNCETEDYNLPVLILENSDD